MYRPIRAWARLLVATWYREERRGEPFPSSGPVLLVLNHSNGLADGHFLLASTPRQVRVLAKYKLFSMPLIGFLVKQIGAIPIYRKKDNVDTSLNAESFRAIDEALAQGEVIGVFPEGESRGAPHIRPLKSGVARMALGAEARGDWGVGVRIVPVGVTYEDRDRFRTACHVLVGPPILAHEFRAAFEKDEWPTTEALRDRIQSALVELTVNVPDMEALAVACALERLLPGDGRPLAMRRQGAHDGLLELAKRDPNGAERRAEAVLELDRRIASHGLTAALLREESPPVGKIVASVVLRLLVGIPLLTLALIVWGLPVLLARTIAKRGASTPDKVVTVTILITFHALLPWVAGLAVLAFVFLPLELAWAAILAISIGLIAFPRVWEERRRVRRDLARLRLAGAPEERTALCAALDQLASVMPVSE